MVNNRYESGFEDNVITNPDILYGGIRNDKNNKSELRILPNDKSGENIFELHRENSSGTESLLSTNSRFLNINNNVGKSMAFINISLFAYSIFTLAQVKETPDLVNYGALGIMVMMLFGYILWMQKRYDRQRDKMMQEHRDERKEWREASEKQHQEIVILSKETRTAIQDFHILFTRIEAKL